MLNAQRFFSLLGGCCVLIVTIALSWSLRWSGLISYLVAINVVTLLLYGCDKIGARRRGRRVPENVLHAFAFIGGTVGALAAQNLFRHKTAKRSFRIVFWVLVLMQVGIVAWALWYFR